MKRLQRNSSERRNEKPFIVELELAKVKSNWIDIGALAVIGTAAAIFALGSMVNSCSRKLSDETKSKAPLSETIRNTSEERVGGGGLTSEF